MRAIEERDEKKIASFVENRYGQKMTEFDDNHRDYLYRGDFLRTKGQKPLIDFIRMGKLHQKTFVTGDSSVLLVFIPEKFLSDSEKFGFYHKNLLTKYFMCEFYLIDNGWKMMNLCLGETDNVVFPESIPN